MRATVLTLGYQQRSLDEFVALVCEAGVDVLVDVRETAWSHKPGFSKTAFSRALEEAGVAYLHLPFAGNPKWLRQAASSHAECLEWYDWYLDEFDEIVAAFDSALEGWLADGKRAVLTCFERHSDDCHRSILADRWAARARGRRVSHLATEGCPRLVRAPA